MSPDLSGLRAAVVVMAKQPAAGRTKTRLSPPLSAVEAADLYEALLQDTIAAVSGLRSVRLAVGITPAEAVDAMRPGLPEGALLVPVDGADLGDCLAHVTSVLFAAGFRRVMAINSDGPTLPCAHIETARLLLDRHDVVVGPSEDGGYYLVGLNAPRPELFSGIAWSTGRVAAQTLERAASLGLSAGLLPPWYDVDTAADLARLHRELVDLPGQTLTHTRRFFEHWDAGRWATASP